MWARHIASTSLEERAAPFILKVPISIERRDNPFLFFSVFYESFPPPRPSLAHPGVSTVESKSGAELLPVQSLRHMANIAEASQCPYRMVMCINYNYSSNGLVYNSNQRQQAYSGKRSSQTTSTMLHRCNPGRTMLLVTFIRLRVAPLHGTN